MRLVAFHFGIIAFIVGCATATKNPSFTHQEFFPPEYHIRLHQQDAAALDQNLQNISDSSSQMGVKWWALYRRAQLWAKLKPATSCDLFAQLAKQQLFPLSSIAGLHARQICPDNQHGLSELSRVEDIDAFDSWLKPKALDVALEQVEHQGDKSATMKLSLLKSKESHLRQEKIDLTRRALKIARALQDKEAIADIEDRLYHLAPSLNPHPSRKDWLKVAYDFRRDRKFTSARKFYRKILTDREAGFRERQIALQGIATTFKLARNLDANLVWLEKAAQETEKYFRQKPSSASTKLYNESTIQLIRAQWTMGNVRAAQKKLIQLGKNLQGKHSLAEVFWLRGRMAEEKQEFDQAIEWFKKAIAEKITDPDFRDKLYWNLSWNELKRKNYSISAEHLKNMRDLTQNSFARAKFNFWLAKATQAQGDTETAKLEFERLIDEDPIGYYGLMAHRELGRPISFPNLPPVVGEVAPFPHKKNPLPHDLIEILNPLYIKWLISVEETDIAKRYLDHISSTYRQQNNQSQHSWLTLFNYYAQAGNYLDLFAQLGNLTPEQRKEIFTLQPELIFPTPFSEQVRQASDQFGLSREFIYAIMRQESAFNPEARSPADAYGLLQLLPEIARQTAPQLGLQFEKAEDLFDPGKNIPIGTFHLKQLWEKHGGKFILATASYNAREEALRNWLRTRYRGDTLEFIEDIPYEETQGYIKLVMRNLIFYMALNAKEPITFPQWCLELPTPDA